MTQNLKTTMQLAVLLLLGVCAALPVAGQGIMPFDEETQPSYFDQLPAGQKSNEQLPPGDMEWKDGADCTDIAQALLKRDGCLEVPNGTFFIIGELTLPNRSGGWIKGVGPCYPTTYKGPHKGPASRLVFVGDGECGIRVLGSEQRIENLTLYSHLPRKKRRASRSRIGILTTKPGKGIATGKLSIHRVNFYGWECGSQAGSHPAMNNCDKIRQTECLFMDCGEGFRQHNTQSMGNVLEDCQWLLCERNVAIDGGGHLHLIRPLAITGTLLTFTDRNPTKPLYCRTGKNNRPIVVSDLKVDARNRGNFRLIETLGDCGAHVEFRGGMVSGPNAVSVGTVGPSMKVSGLESIEFATTPRALETIVE